MQFLNPSRWYLHPVFIFSCSIIALAAALVITVYWYMEITAALETIIKKFHIEPALIFPSKTGMLILVLTLLVTVVLTGILLAFIYYQKTANLFRLQHNFIYNFTHELKTPVTSLKIYIETFIRHDLDPADIKKYSEYMLKDVGKLTENINRILNLAKMESGSYGAELIHADPVELIRNFADKNQTLFRELEITIEPGESSGFVVPVNVFLFEMLLMNLISNAAKYNDSQTPKLTITTDRIKNRYRIHFADNGIGIDKKETGKIFRKFYQSHREHAGEVKGSGLGLYLVFSIARIHGWKVAAQSDGPARGTVFTLFIPGDNSNDTGGKTLWKMLKKSVSWS